GKEEQWGQDAADAFVDLMLDDSGEDSSGRAKSDVVFVCDLSAYRRGRTQHGEVCHVVNGGPVPVDVVRDAVDDDAFIKAVLHDGVKIDTVKHFGRHISAALRTALELGPPPEF